METIIEIHPYAERVFTALFVDENITVEMSHTENFPMLDFVVLDNGQVFQE